MEIFVWMFRHYFSWVWKNVFWVWWKFGTLLNAFMEMKIFWTVDWGIARGIHGYGRFFELLLGCHWILICDVICLTQWPFGMANFYLFIFFCERHFHLVARIFEWTFLGVFYGYHDDWQIFEVDYIFQGRLFFFFFFAYCRVSRTRVAFSCWNKATTYYHKTLEMSSME